MDALALVPNLALWALVVLLVVGEIVLARQVGLLHSRLPPVSARPSSMGPALGAHVDALEAKGLLDRSVLLGTPPGKLGALLVFVAPGCSACAELAPALRSLERSDGHDLHLVVVSIDGDESGNRAYARSHRLDTMDYVTDPLAGGRYGVTATPYAMLLDHENVVRAKGIVNTLEQLESILLVLPQARSLRVLP